ncbi:MAG: hypothetical protein PHG63_00135 [Candidatus Dojkabacteria bacterium]|nr:hypothetical protein [Candidatus Dojkabacteria bacterium]
MQRPTDLGLLIVVGGPGGTGSTTIAKILAQKWNLHRVYAGDMMRNQDRHHNLNGYLINHAAKHPEIDRSIDQFMVRMSYYPNILIEGKCFAAIATTMGIPCSLRIWVTCDVQTRVYHILEREGILAKEGHVSPKSDIYRKTRDDLMQRQANDMKRYRKLYGVDISKPEIFNDVVLDSTGLNIPFTIKKLFDEIKNNDSLRKRFTPKQLRY